MSSLLLVLFVSLTTVSFSDADHSDVVIARLLEVQESSSEEGVFFLHSASLCIQMKTISSFLFFQKGSRETEEEETTSATSALKRMYLIQAATVNYKTLLKFIKMSVDQSLGGTHGWSRQLTRPATHPGDSEKSLSPTVD